MVAQFGCVKSGFADCSFGSAWGSNLVLLSDYHWFVVFPVHLVAKSLFVTINFLTLEPPSSLLLSKVGEYLELEP